MSVLSWPCLHSTFLLIIVKNTPDKTEKLWYHLRADPVKAVASSARTIRSRMCDPEFLRERDNPNLPKQQNPQCTKLSWRKEALEKAKGVGEHSLI